jgi:hypothetical protein
MALPGTVVVVAGESLRSTVAQQCLLRVRMPQGTKVETIAGTCNVARNRNLAVSCLHGHWLWMLDDDLVFPPETLLRLLAHLDRDDVDVVVPHVLIRHPPYYAAVYTSPMPGNPRPVVLNPAAYEPGLIPVFAAGTSGMLIKRRVLETLSPPWFVNGQLGQPSALDEDLHFCTKVQAAGFRIWADTTIGLGHLAPAMLWPQLTAAGWLLAYQPLRTISPDDTAQQIAALAAQVVNPSHAPQHVGRVDVARIGEPVPADDVPPDALIVGVAECS